MLKKLPPTHVSCFPTLTVVFYGVFWDFCMHIQKNTNMESQFFLFFIEMLAYFHICLYFKMTFAKEVHYRARNTFLLKIVH